jgi:hypothetical protein
MPTTERMMCPMCERRVAVVGPTDARRLGKHRDRHGPCSGSGTTAARAAEWREAFERKHCYPPERVPYPPGFKLVGKRLRGRWPRVRKPKVR